MNPSRRALFSFFPFMGESAALGGGGAVERAAEGASSPPASAPTAALGVEIGAGRVKFAAAGESPPSALRAALAVALLATRVWCRQSGAAFAKTPWTWMDDATVYLTSAFA